ncbi:ABC transporter ATP-binding protein [Alkalicoccobacillus porphyridii]|uniref:ABC transporter ATP-binding protein n=1 Tax=Alkalicoccobacillus porphyridii TaxID=2597270 RepID=A0A553ZXN2_9BACI|nr:ABC transporter ATP-binding protein [Alkalicoccobacillus porphyridii]TSB46194.1 ABC transporter ATP-binding protein [Alkalicoccobacillus porphyridii]
MLETTELEKRYKGKAVVDKVNLYLNEGESIGLLGPNGAGKSTTISMISSLLKPTSGEVHLYGKSMIKNPSDLRKMIGVVPQDIALYEDLSAFENLQFFGRLYQLGGIELKEKIEETLQIVGLTDRKKELVKTFSGGMKRRINIAAALLHNPKLVIMDEPTVGIDPQSRNHILETVRLLNQEKGMAVLYTSHYMEEVEQLCDRMYIMDHGKVIASGTKTELQQILSEEDKILIQLNAPCKELVHELKQLESVKELEEEENQIKLITQRNSGILMQSVIAAERLNVQIVDIRVNSPSLEDVFLHLTGRTLRD